MQPATLWPDAEMQYKQENKFSLWVGSQGLFQFYSTRDSSHLLQPSLTDSHGLFCACPRIALRFSRHLIREDMLPYCTTLQEYRKEMLIVWMQTYNNFLEVSLNEFTGAFF